MQNPNRKTIIALCVLAGIVSSSVSSSSKSTQSPAPFFKDKERGWFWHERYDEDEEEVALQKQNTPETPTETVELSTEWLKEAIPRLMEKAINNPTNENLASYAYAQRLMLDQASRFSSRMSEFMQFETALDESARRPTAAFALTEFGRERSGVVGDAIAQIKNNSKGLFFFYSSDCGFCHRMIPVLNEFKRRHGINILAISLDGGLMEGMEGMDVVDDVNLEVATKFNVSLTPTIHLMLNNNEAEMVLEGMKALDELENRLLFAGRKAEIISKEMYAKTRNVREINVFKNSDGNIIADKDKIDNDPAYLSELLKMQLSDAQIFGTRVIRR